MKKLVHLQDEDKRHRTILVAIDGSSSSLQYLEKIAELAAGLQVHLAGLYVEDEELLIAADLPFTKEVCFHVADKPINFAQIERDMRLLSSNAKAHFEEIATRWKIQWSFQTIRGRVVHELSEAAKTADIFSCSTYVFKDLQNTKANHSGLSTELPCLLFPDQITYGNDIIVFASKHKPLNELVSPISNLLKANRLVVICSPEIYSQNKDQIDEYLLRVGRPGKKGQLVINSQPIQEWAYDILGSCTPKLVIVDKNTPFANSTQFYALLALAKCSGLLV